MSRNYLDYDIETFPNIFTMYVIDEQTGEELYFEISNRVNDREPLCQWLEYWKVNQYRGVGFNNLGFDYPVVHRIYNDPNMVTPMAIYNVAQAIIDTDWNNRFVNRIPEWNHIFEQVDLYLINHFDNMARATSLKKLEFVMRANNIEDLPFPVGQDVPEDGFEKIKSYNRHDVVMTSKFFHECKSAIEFRDVMSAKTGNNYLNYNDTKIGKQYFINKLEENGVDCFRTVYDPETGRNKKVPIQTHRQTIDIGSIIFDYIQFKTKPFNDVLNTMRSKVISETKGALSLSATYDDFTFDFGLGGIHGSVTSTTFVADDEFAIFDWDVASYYPNIAIKNGIYPEHLSTVFCDVYEDVYKQRKSYPKGSPENKAMKLALNGVYGDSNSKWSTMFDSKYTMAVTVNGQLMLCMLAEEMMQIPDLTMIQINTDGLTFKLPRKYIDRMNQIVKDWETLTKLELEDAEYKRMAVRDVNNYIATGVDGKIKYKGAYNGFGAHEHHPDSLDFAKNHSALVIKKAACAAIVEGIPVRKFIKQHTDIMDFMILCNAQRNHKLKLGKTVYLGDKILDENFPAGSVQRITRYYVSNDGYKLFKVMPSIKRKTNKVKMTLPFWKSRKVTGLNKNYEATCIEHYLDAMRKGYVCADGGDYYNSPERVNQLEVGYNITVANQIDGEIDMSTINYEYYIEKAEELVNGVMKNGVK